MAMRFFHNMSLRRKQTLIIMLTSSAVLLIACAAFTGYDISTYRRELVERVAVLADVAGNNCAAALDFNDSTAAEETLTALQADENVISAAVYTRDGHVFAAYHRPGDASSFPPAAHSAGQEFEDNKLNLFRLVKQKGEVVGTIYVASDLTKIAVRVSRYIVIAGLVFLASLLAGLILSSRLQRLVSDPILRLADMARLVAIEKNYSVRAAKYSNDELGQLVDGFNEMLSQIQTRDTALQNARNELEKRVEERTKELESTHRELVEASRRGGMAEIATNVLHNVGNVLNSVNVSTDLIVENLKNSKASNLEKVVTLLEEYREDLGTFLTTDAKGKHIPIYLAQLSAHLKASHEAMFNESNSLRRNVEHIKEIVAMQQDYATFGGHKEAVDVVELVEDSLRMNEGTLSRHHLEVIREYGKVPLMDVEKHKILQILVNLVRNAKYACDDSGREDKKLTMRVSCSGKRVKIEVIDNGIGIPAENLTRIFNHGFTTRKGGHGFGLHSSALAAKEMGGALTVTSEGTGRGATFTLELPIPEPGVGSDQKQTT